MYFDTIREERAPFFFHCCLLLLRFHVNISEILYYQISSPLSVKNVSDSDSSDEAVLLSPIFYLGDSESFCCRYQIRFSVIVPRTVRFSIAIGSDRREFRL